MTSKSRNALRANEIRKLVDALGRKPNEVEMGLLEEAADCYLDMKSAREKSETAKLDNQIQGYLNSAQRTGRHRLQILKAIGIVSSKVKDDGLADMFKDRSNNGDSSKKNSKSKKSNQKKAHKQKSDPISELLET